MALETENRQLTRQVGDRAPERESSETLPLVLARLDALDSRLARLEGLIGEVRDHRLERIEDLFREIRQQPLK